MRESLNHALVDVSLDAVVDMDGEGHVVEFNPAAEQLFGYSREEAVGQLLGTLIVPPHLREAHRAYRTACDNSRAIAELRRCAGTQFDPEVVEGLVSVLEATALLGRPEAQHA